MVCLFWNYGIELFPFMEMFRFSDGSGQRDNDVLKRHKSQKKIDVREDINTVPSNVQFLRQEA